MAANIYGIISTDPEPTVNLDVPEIAGGRRIWGVAHLWLEGATPTPTAKWAVYGSARRNDSARFITIPAATLGRLADKLGIVFTRSKVTMDGYEFDPSRSFMCDLILSQADLDLIA